MDDAFTLLRQAVDVLPQDAMAGNGQTVGDVRKEIELQEREMALDELIEIADIHPASITLWEMLSEAARQMVLDHSRRGCEWRGEKAKHGTIRATLTLLGADEGGRHSAFSGDGQLRPLWDIGHRTADGQQDLNIARLWVECEPQLGPGRTAHVRLTPLQPEQGQHLQPGDVITMHETQPAAEIAEIIEDLPPRA
ncbi:hypothetical protein ACH4C6_28635 [Streptomyces sp. NPDC017943]|uniref:hypothetical protein n=1 Tax=Streptomyces sp. NPDC017943 TaxID=3365019 RepID=UPI0037BA3D59